MDLKPRRPGETSTQPARMERPQFEECRGHLVFTLADGATTGFPLSWLYRFDYRKDEAGERFLLHLTDHRVTVQGKGLVTLEDRLKNGEGFHISELPDRYLSIRRSDKAHIDHITIEPTAGVTNETSTAHQPQTPK